jgi:hypothetical protein
MPVSCQRRGATILMSCTLLYIRGFHTAFQLDHFDKVGQVFFLNNNEQSFLKNADFAFDFLSQIT